MDGEGHGFTVNNRGWDGLLSKWGEGSFMPTVLTAVGYVV
jgi:hypothetical protein